jgi:hypothetical protein
MVDYEGPFREELHLEPLSRFRFSFGNSGDDALPVALDFAENGGFVTGVWHISTAQGTRSLVLNLPHVPAPRGELVGLGDDTFSSAMHMGFLDTQAVAKVAPMVSVVSPRPGSYIDGYRRLLVILRDPAVTDVNVLFTNEAGEDIPEATCAFVPVVNGVSRDCVISPSSFPENTFRILAEIVGTDAEGQIRTRRWVWYELPTYN